MMDVSKPGRWSAARQGYSDRRGLTLFELMLVLGILLILSTLVIPVVSGHLSQSRKDVTWQSLRRVRDVVMNTFFDDMGQRLPRPGLSGLRAGRMNHPQLCYLFVNPKTHEDDDLLTMEYDTNYDPISRRGWRGPYLQHEGGGFEYAEDEEDEEGGFTRRYGETGDPAVMDGWGNPILLQEPDDDGDGLIDFDEARHVRLVSAGPNGIVDTKPDEMFPVLAARGDDLVLFLRIAE